MSVFPEPTFELVVEYAKMSVISTSVKYCNSILFFCNLK